MSPEEDRTRDAADSEPKHYQLSYSSPLYPIYFSFILLAEPLMDEGCNSGIVC